MSKFCELAGKMTNCTDDCKRCLEEETNDREIKVGDRVRYITDATTTKRFPVFYPPKGTIGTVIGIEDSPLYLIRWPEGTTLGDGRWYAKEEDIELV